MRGAWCDNMSHERKASCQRPIGRPNQMKGINKDGVAPIKTVNTANTVTSCMMAYQVVIPIDVDPIKCGNS